MARFVASLYLMLIRISRLVEENPAYLASYNLLKLLALALSFVVQYSKLRSIAVK